MDESLLNKVFEKVVGDTVHMPCPVFHKKGLYYEWTNGGQIIDELYSSSRFRVEEDTGYLKIKKLKSTDSGVYVCRAVNGFGSAVGYIELQVMTLEAKRIKDGINENKLPNKLAEGPSVPKKPKVRNSFKPIPIFPRTEHEIYTHIGQDVSLVFRAKGQPAPKAWWYFKSHPLPNKLSPSQYKEETTYSDIETMVTTLTLFNVTTKLAGKYSVRAVNEKGLTEAVFILGVYPLFKTEIVGEYPVNLTIPQGDSLKLSCKMRAHNEPRIQWIKRSEPLILQQSTNRVYTVTCPNSHIPNSIPPSGILLSPPASPSSSSPAITASPLHGPSGNQVNSMISSNTITLTPKNVLSPVNSLGKSTSSTSTGPTSDCTNHRRRRNHPPLVSDRRKAIVSEIISSKSTLGYIGNNIFESILVIDDFNVSDIGYYICLSLATNELRQIKVEMAPKQFANQLLEAATSLATREHSSSFSTVNQFNHTNFIAFHAIFWLIGSVIFLCCMASILFLLSVKKSLQASNNLHPSAMDRSKRHQMPANSTPFIEATNIHTLNDLPIHLEPVTTVKSNVQSSIGRQRVGLTEVVIENHMVPKNSNERQFVCSRHRSSRPGHFGPKMNEPADPHSSPRNNLFKMNDQTCDQWSPTPSSNDKSDKCSCSQSFNSCPSGRSVVHSGNYYPGERANRTAIYRNYYNGKYDSDEITVIN